MIKRGMYPCLFLFFVLFLFFKSSTDAVYKGLWSGIQRFQKSDPAVLSVNTSALAIKVRSDNFVLIASRADALEMFADNCDIVLQDTVLLSIVQAPLLPKGSALTKPLSDMYVLLFS